MLACLQGDKKVKQGRVRFVLPTAIGTVEIRDDVDTATILAALDRIATPEPVGSPELIRAA